MDEVESVMMGDQRPGSADRWVARAPVRISFAGGGTDLPAYYERFGGFVVSAAITRYAHVSAAPSRNGAIHITSIDYGQECVFPRGELPTVDEPLSLPRAAIRLLADGRLRERGVHLTLSCEVKPGTGLGSSSAMAVALVHALSAYQGRPLTADEAADLACRLEIDRLQMPIGKQDQYASAFGGLNGISFGREGVEVTPVDLPADAKMALSGRLLLFSTGRSRHSSSILRQQRANTGTNTAVTASLHCLKDLAFQLRDALAGQDLDRFGRLLDEGWQYKKRLAGGISAPDIDRWYETARAAGALGGKITGAGGGGHLLLYCPPEHRPQLRAAMTACGLTELEMDFDFAGAGIVDRPIRLAAVQPIQRQPAGQVQPAERTSEPVAPEEEQR